MNEKEKFTPGPWEVFDWISSITVREGKKMVCRCTKNEQGKVYAVMIAAAPEMYNSNETTLSELENIVSGLERACDHCDRYLMRGKRACRNCAAEKAKKIAQGMRDRISELQKKARGEQEK